MALIGAAGESTEGIMAMLAVDEILVAGHRHQQAGGFSQAEQLYRQAVQAQPEHAEAWRALADFCLACHRATEAASYYERVLRLQPSRADIYVTLALALMETGQKEAARARLEQALRLRPDLAEAHAALGNLLAELERLPEAVVSYQQALRLRPTDAETATNLGIALARQGRFAEAVAAFRQALAQNPGLARTYLNLGVALSQQGHPEEGLVNLREAVRLRPDYAEAHYNLGNVLSDQRQYEQAVESYRRALAAKPDYADACNNVGVALNHLGRSGEAAVFLQQAVRLRPDFAESHNNLGLALADLGRFAAAEAAYQEALRLNPRHADAHANLACVYQWQGRWAEAEAAFQLALWFEPDAASLHWNRALFWLQRGDFERGWAEYEWRWKRPNAAVYAKGPRTFAQPRWDGSGLTGQRVLLYMEQGLGDMIQFIRYAPLLKKRGATVLVECPGLLRSLLSTCPGVEVVVCEGEPLPAFDVHVPLMSLPGLFGTTLVTAPADVPYLFAPADGIERWRQRLASETGYKVGIVWQGNPHHRWDHHRSVPLEQFSPLARIAGVRLFSVQYGPGTEQLSHWGERLPITALDVGDFVETACVLKNLDLIVTVDTATAHLAGALGVPVWVLLSAISDWRWLCDRADSPWYPTMRLFRQRRLDRWQPVFRAVARALRQGLAGRRETQHVPQRMEWTDEVRR